MPTRFINRLFHIIIILTGIWTYPSDTYSIVKLGIPYSVPFREEQVLYDNGVLYSHVDGAIHPEISPRLFAIDIGKKKIIWSVTGFDGYTTSVQKLNNMLLVTTVINGVGSLNAVDIRNGSVVVSYNVPHYILKAFVVNYSYNIVTDDGLVLLYRLSPDGKLEIRDQIKTKDKVLSAWKYDDILLLRQYDRTKKQEYVISLDIENPSMEKRKRLFSCKEGIDIITNNYDTFYAICDGTISKYGGKKMQRIWTRRRPNDSGNYHVYGLSIYYQSNQGTIGCMDGGKGNALINKRYNICTENRDECEIDFIKDGYVVMRDGKTLEYRDLDNNIVIAEMKVENRTTFRVINTNDDYKLLVDASGNIYIITVEKSNQG